MAMKTTSKILLILLVVAGMFALTSCNEEKQLPEKITVSGQVTYENGDLAEGVTVEVVSSDLMVIPTPVDMPVYTDENGHYTYEFKPNENLTYTVRFQINKDGDQYSYQEALTKWEAEQVCNAVLKKVEE